MTPSPKQDLKRTSKKRLIWVSLFGILSIAILFFYINFNRILSDALKKAFESTLMAEVYELQFENLRVNPLVGTISVMEVTLQPRAFPKKNYPYINSLLHMKTKRMNLEEVDILLLLKAHRLEVKKIAISEPEIELDINSNNPIFLPFQQFEAESAEEKTAFVNSYFLEAFELENASFKVINSVQNREFLIRDFSILLSELQLDRNDLEDIFFLKHVSISLGQFDGKLRQDPLKHISFSDFTINLDTVDVKKNLDTLIFNFQDFTSGIKNLDIQTQDSLFHITMNSFDLAYRDRAILLAGLSFKPNVSNATIQKNYKFQHTQFSGTVGKVGIEGLHFDSLIYHNALFIEEIHLDSISALIYKDNTKAKDLNHFPEYLGQVIAGIKNPVRINSLKATNVTLRNEERKPDGALAKVNITGGTAEVKNITNLAPNKELKLSASAYLADRVKFNLSLNFSYLRPQFSFEGRLEKFDLVHMNPVIQAYTPAKFTAGTSNDIAFSGIAQRSGSTGTLTFLYQDLKVDLELHDKAKWKSNLIAFGANTALHSNNPASANLPARAVKFQADRDMNKGFVNLIVKSILDGMKETMLLSKENRKDFKEAKREARKEARKETN